VAISPGLFGVGRTAELVECGGQAETGLPAPRNPRALIRSIQRDQAHDDDDDD